MHACRPASLQIEHTLSTTLIHQPGSSPAFFNGIKKSPPCGGIIEN
ncbi:hypothetical protein SynRS9915_00565 [Synechococcus sp. RS9915]|nr:hypothetical protein SynRS9915_00565 [Synechococcus sp. RS9915]